MSYGYPCQRTQNTIYIGTYIYPHNCISEHIPTHRFNLLIAYCQGWVSNNIYGHLYTGYTSSRHVDARVCFFHPTPMATYIYDECICKNSSKVSQALAVCYSVNNTKTENMQQHSHTRVTHGFGTH